MRAEHHQKEDSTKTRQSNYLKPADENLYREATVKRENSQMTKTRAVCAVDQCHWAETQQRTSTQAHTKTSKLY